MTQVPIISGIYSDSGPALRTGYPVNIEPVPKASGISQGYLRTSEGMTQVGTGPGVCRGGIEWNGQELRVFGTSLCSVNGDVVVAIGTTSPVSAKTCLKSATIWSRSLAVASIGTRSLSWKLTPHSDAIQLHLF